MKVRRGGLGRGQDPGGGGGGGVGTRVSLRPQRLYCNLGPRVPGGLLVTQRPRLGDSS